MTERTNDYELAVRRQFSSFCKKVIHNAAYDYKLGHTDKRDLMEISMDDLFEEDRKYLKTMDTYDSDYEHFEVAGMNLKAQFKDERLLQAINKLSARQKEVLLLSVVEEETDTRIAEILNLDRSTVSEHRKSTLYNIEKINEYLEHFLEEE
ncbi:MAG: sigma-70 family RNA polymerase sigma factor [Lachnospiraceae bacterium]|nr:sigma-70 family RNA polymerase sigma factor [Lachnospiraceae bacterium]